MIKIEKKMNFSDEKELIKQARVDPEAFGVIFDRYHDILYSYILRRVGNVQVAQDIVAETFFKALSRLWQFRWRNISILNWLYRIATNEMNQYFRRQKYKPLSLDFLFKEVGFEISSEIDILEEILEQERELIEMKEWQTVRKQIELLPEKYQEVLTLRYFESKKIAEIAEILGKKEGTIKSLVSRAISRLRQKRNEKES